MLVGEEMGFEKDQLKSLRQHGRTLRNLLSRARARQVQAISIKNASKKLVNEFFDVGRPAFRSQGLDDESLVGLDKWMQELLSHTQKASLKTNYTRTLKAIQQELNGIEVALLTASSTSHASGPARLDGKEARIATTLSSLVPSAGLSYEQACLDLRDASRRSYRGAATELRESMREVLDHLAPDSDVTGQRDFKLDPDHKKPTMKQKVRFILASRGKGRSQTAPAESSTSIVEEGVGALARSVYDRSSLSTHVGTSRQEVQQIKAYVDVVLGELLEIA